MYQRNESYEYLGKSAASNGGDPKKVDEIIDTNNEQVQKIGQCILPLPFNVCALN